MYGVGGSEAISRDMNSLLFSSTFENSSEREYVNAKSRELMSSDLHHPHPHPHHHHQQQQLQQQNQSSGLMRYRSAPSSFFASLLDGSGSGGDGNGSEDYLNFQSSSPESEPIFARFVSGNGSGESDSRDLLQYPATMKHEMAESVPQQNRYPAADSPRVYSTALARDLPNHSSVSSTGPSMDSSFMVMNSMAMENLNQVKTRRGDCSNLIRQSSSPAGFLSNVTVENGFAIMGDGGNFRASNVEASSPTSRMNNHMNISSGPSTCSRFNPRIAENGNDGVKRGGPDNGNLGNGTNTTKCRLPSIPNDSWDDSTFTSLKRNRDGDLKMFSSLNRLDTRNGDSIHYNSALTHHLSLPKTSAEMATVEKYLQFQGDAVPCKIRAKRGFATHPRSIAERVRRTRISERMRKLQELFPNMDKQTNTADMLDLAVEYIKDLQKEVQTLTDTRSRCTCSNKQK